MMKKKIILLSLIMGLAVAGCRSQKDSNPEIIGGADAPTIISFETDNDDVKDEDAGRTEEKLITIDDELALSAIKNYCHINNPDLKDIESAGEYPVSWEVSSSAEHEIVILFRSYTGALIRYYIDPVSGDTYVTEFVQGITDEEERTDESFNIRDYL